MNGPGMQGLEAGTVVWVTGAGSGMGRASAVAAASRGARVALSGRRREPLAETAQLVEQAGGQALVLPLDARDTSALAAGAERIGTTWDRIGALVQAAGLNVASRYWRDQDLAEFDDVVATNLTAVARIVATVLPDLRATGGQLVVISSYSAWRFSPNAGVAYTASKSALAALCASVNQQEATSGVRACHLCPGDVNSDFLALRPQVPDERARAAMLSPEDVGRAVLFVLDSAAHVRIDELVLSPVSQT